MSFQSSGSMLHIFGTKNQTLSLPRYNDLTSGLENLEIYLKLYQLLLSCLKISFRIVADKEIECTSYEQKHNRPFKVL